MQLRNAGSSKSYGTPIKTHTHTLTNIRTHKHTHTQTHTQHTQNLHNFCVLTKLVKRKKIYNLFILVQMFDDTGMYCVSVEAHLRELKNKTIFQLNVKK